MIPCLFLNPRNGKETPENFHSIFCNACHHRKYHHRIALCKSPKQTGSVTERREKKEKDVFCPCGKIIYLFTENYATIATSQTTNNMFSPVHFERTTLFISHSSYKAEKADSVFYKACHTFLFHSLFIGPRPSHFLFFFFLLFYLHSTNFWWASGLDEIWFSVRWDLRASRSPRYLQRHNISKKYLPSNSTCPFLYESKSLQLNTRLLLLESVGREQTDFNIMIPSRQAAAAEFRLHLNSNYPLLFLHFPE